MVDGRIGCTGGIGIADKQAENARNGDEWRDTHYRVTGPVVAQMQSASSITALKRPGSCRMAMLMFMAGIAREQIAIVEADQPGSREITLTNVAIAWWRSGSVIDSGACSCRDSEPRAPERLLSARIHHGSFWPFVVWANFPTH
jgi:hypothetical protein